MVAWILIDKGIFKMLNVEVFQGKNKIFYRYLIEPNKYASDSFDIDPNLIDKTMEYIGSCIETGKVIDLRVSNIYTISQL